MIHAQDLWKAYATILKHPDVTGHINASTEIGLRTAQIATKIAQKMGAAGAYVTLSADSVIA